VTAEKKNPLHVLSMLKKAGGVAMGGKCTEVPPTARDALNLRRKGKIARSPATEGEKKEGEPEELEYLGSDSFSGSWVLLCEESQRNKVKGS